MTKNETDNQINPQTKSAQAQREEAVLKFWAEKNIFEKAVAKPAPSGDFIFYEGPPTANAKPALHHLEARAFKDVIPRYKTMQGFHVPRRAGWDTHGLPVELQIEKKLGLKSKKEIEEYGVAKFNKECRESVFEFISDWEEFTDRIGYWVDKSKAYYTFDTNYVESLWSVVKKIADQKIDGQSLLYKDYRIVPWCARCGTALSSHELAQGYADIKDLSVTAKFKVVGEENTFLLAWTTTPWTLPGNVALAVGEKIDYVKIKKENEFYILAESRLSIVEGEYEVISKVKGSELVGLSYEPLYPYISQIISGPEKEKMEKAYKVYSADFVTTEDGTGIVHTAVMYGADDFELGTKIGLPKFHTVDAEGKFIAGTDFLAGRFVKDEDVAVDIIKDLANRKNGSANGSLLFDKKKYEHNYPHCWRCKTPLIYYARDSWYIAMSKLRDKLISENEKINWEPEHIKDGRFGEWLREVKDWAISRERYWGTPLPVWVADDGEKIIIDSFETLKKYSKDQITKIIFVRHGQSEFNLSDTHSSALGVNPITELGKEQAQHVAKILMKEDIDVVITSPLLRVVQTADYYCKESGIAPIVDNRLAEITNGIWEGKSNSDPSINESREEYLGLSESERYEAKRGGNGESFADLDVRVENFLEEILEKHKGKTIVCFAHQGTNSSAIKILKKIKNSEAITKVFHNMDLVGNGAVAPIYINSETKRELDPHRPYIDEIVLEKDGKEFHRVKEVMDVWFDSGAMPFAQDHYPFENKEWIEGQGYPADFISEAIDQTRGWFYTLLAVGVLTGRGTPYKNVICLGHLLDKDGKKMSKSIGNIVNPWEQMDKYGVDVLRLWMFSVNQPGEGKNYDENVVRELASKTFGLLYNVLAFYELYRDESLEKGEPSENSENSAQKNKNSGAENVLDAWILARLNQLTSLTTKSLDEYRMIEPVRAIRDFIGDLSTWYLRRSRDRLKVGDKNAKQTLYIVMKKLAQLLAPFAPFSAEDIWQKLKNQNDAESVHLSVWPKAEEVEHIVIKNMERTRKIVERGLAERQENKIPVRQPLSQISVSDSESIPREYIEIIKSELNVKSINYVLKLGTGSYSLSGSDLKITLDTNITDELRAEGNIRELIRAIQEMRKTAGLTPSDIVTLSIDTNDNGKTLVEKFSNEIKKTVLASEMNFAENNGEEIKIENNVFKIKIEK